ncbi:hypothetical protein DRP77_12320 [Candidatus Poribacteria bacterium]|nr:MAG: hypothetical protein DRP77_12320 [Candidatus Poribacteria bacterium]
MARRIALIGIDSLIPTVVEKLVEEGKLPTIKRLMEEGGYSRADPFYPTETGCNWATIATGATPRTHGCTYSVHLPGDPLNRLVSGFPSHMCQADQIWCVFDRAGRLSVIFDYPQSYPINARNVIHVGEDGFAGPSSRALDTPRGYRSGELGEKGFFRTYGARLELIPRPELSEKVRSLKPPLVGEVEMGGSTFSFVISARKGGFYDTVSLYAGREFDRPLAEAGRGEWSGWVIRGFPRDGGEVKAAFRFKVINLSPDGRDFLIYRTEIYPQEGFTHPPHWAERLVRECGPYLRRPSEQGVVFAESMDIETFYEEWADHGRWTAKAAELILSEVDWSLFILKWHGPDYMQHICWHMIDPIHPLHEPEKADYGWDYFARYYGIVDDLVRRIWDLVGEDGVIALVSDHGHIANLFAPGHRWLEEAGLLVRRSDGTVDWSKTKAYPTYYGVWVNLRGRDPNGIVEPGEEYERVRDEIIRAALEVRERNTGEPAYLLAARREDLEFMGLGGERCPDVVLACRPIPLRRKLSKEEYERMVGGSMWHISTGTHGEYLPSTKLSIGTIQALFAAAGPGLKKGYRRPKPISLAQVAPTLCKLANLPPPRDSEFGPVRDFLAN